jgi:hypothetical protein
VIIPFLALQAFKAMLERGREWVNSPSRIRPALLSADRPVLTTNPEAIDRSPRSSSSTSSCLQDRGEDVRKR